jgi:hypothetical protein
MARMCSRNRAEFDGDTSVILRNLSAGAVTATTSEAPVSLNALTKAYWDNNEQPQGVFTVAIECTAMKQTVLDEVYTWIIQVDSVVGFTVPVEIARVTYNSVNTFQRNGVGFYEIAIPYSFIELLAPTAKFIRLQTVVVGTLPSVTAGAHITYIDN